MADLEIVTLRDRLVFSCGDVSFFILKRTIRDAVRDIVAASNLSLLLIEKFRREDVFLSLADQIIIGRELLIHGDTNAGLKYKAKRLFKVNWLVEGF